MLWLDTYQPKRLDDLSYHHDITQTLKRFVNNQGFPHLILYGPSGAGKATRAQCLLKGLFGDGVEKVKVDEITLDGSSVPFNIRSSQYHTELYASDLGLRDRQAIQVVIKQISAQPSVSLFQNNIKEVPRYRVFVIHEAHLLTLAAQASLRRTMEKYTQNTRVIMLCERLSGIIAPLKSRCFCIRVAAPPESVIQKTIADVCQSEHYNIDRNYINTLAEAAGGNLRIALIMIQVAYSKKSSSPNLATLEPLWKRTVSDCADRIINDQTSQAVLDIRESLAGVLVACIDAQSVLEALTWRLLRKSTESVRGHIAKAAAHYSWVIARSAGGVKDIAHLEAFAATVMMAIKQAA